MTNFFFHKFMSIFKLSLKIIGQIIFVIIFFSTLQAKNLNKFNEARHVSDYFSGILLLNDSQYNESSKFLKKLNGLEKSHINYSAKYLYSAINSGNFNEALNYSKKLEKQKLDSFESNLVIGVFYLKNSNLELAKKPLICLEYIIVHELVHLLERNHNDKFIAYMDKFMPKWRLHRDELNSLPIVHNDWGY